MNTIKQQGDKVKFQFDCKASPYPPRHLAEEHLVGIMIFSQWISSTTSSPSEVCFQHPKPSDTSEHERIFSCPILFDQNETAIYFPIEFLAAPLTQADPVVSKMMDGYAEQQLIKLPKGENLIDQSRVALATLLQSGEPSLEKLANHLEINMRSLQRRLKEEGLSYQSLLEKTMRQLALAYIQQSHLSLTDIAFLLGFSEQSSFQRAFKRWTEETPGRYRKNL